MIERDVAGADGVRLRVFVEGEGRPVVLLHGFPESHATWRNQIDALVAAGFQTWTPDMRGFGASDKPKGRAPYGLDKLAGDVAAIVRATGAPRAHVVGHDWGGTVAWTFAGHHKDLVDKLAVANGPHIRSYLRCITRPPQLFMSGYIFAIQLPLLAEHVVGRNDFAAVREIFRRAHVRPELIEPIIDGVRAPGALHATLNYYRRNANPRLLRWAASARIEAETLVVWGMRDPNLAPALLDDVDVIAPKNRVVRLPHAGHWIQHQAAEDLSRELVAFLRG